MELMLVSPGKYAVMFYVRDHSLRLANATLTGSELSIEGLSTYRKVFPDEGLTQVVKNTEPISNKTEIQKLNANTVYFRLPTFNHEVKPVVDSLIAANHDLIADTPNLIIDVRNNGGGSDITYAELIQFLYTNKIVLVNNSIWSSTDNIQKFKNILDDPEYPESSKAYLRNLVQRLETSPGAFVKKNDNTLKRKVTLKYPANVVILINRYCASSCEEFVLAARQSKKVTLMGENTMGVLDYANVHTLDLPCAGWGLQYATSRTNRLPDFPIDNIGIKPSIKIPEGKNWLEFAVEYLKYLSKN
jgi:C-terminal processing protease CtpA/Prc